MLLEVERYHLQEAGRMFDGQHYRVQAFIQSVPELEALKDIQSFALASSDIDYIRNYVVAPYLISQGAESHPSFVGLDEGYPSFWVDLAVQSLAVQSSGGEIDYEMLLGPVYSERISGEKVGEPLLGMTAIDATGDEPVFTVEQVQVNRLFTSDGVSFDTFTAVPFAIGCELADHSSGANIGAAGFTACHGSVSGLQSARSQISQAIADFGISGGSSGAPAFSYALFANDMLLGEKTGLYGVSNDGTVPPSDFLKEPRPITWKPYCPSGSVMATCSGDYDGDGFVDDLNGDGLPDELDFDGVPEPYDCSDIAPGISDSAFPLASEPAAIWPFPQTADVVDFNCDGWPVDWSIRPDGKDLAGI